MQLALCCWSDLSNWRRGLIKPETRPLFIENEYALLRPLFHPVEAAEAEPAHFWEQIPAHQSLWFIIAFIALCVRPFEPRPRGIWWIDCESIIKLYILISCFWPHACFCFCRELLSFHKNDISNFPSSWSGRSRSSVLILEWRSRLNLFWKSDGSPPGESSHWINLFLSLSEADCTLAVSLLLFFHKRHTVL